MTLQNQTDTTIRALREYISTLEAQNLQQNRQRLIIQKNLEGAKAQLESVTKKYEQLKLNIAKTSQIKQQNDQDTQLDSTINSQMSFASISEEIVPPAQTIKSLFTNKNVMKQSMFVQGENRPNVLSQKNIVQCTSSQQRLQSMRTRQELQRQNSQIKLLIDNLYRFNAECVKKIKQLTKTAAKAQVQASKLYRNNQALWQLAKLDDNLQQIRKKLFNDQLLQQLSPHSSSNNSPSSHVIDLTDGHETFDFQQQKHQEVLREHHYYAPQFRQSFTKPTRRQNGRMAKQRINISVQQLPVSQPISQQEQYSNYIKPWRQSRAYK